MTLAGFHVFFSRSLVYRWLCPYVVQGFPWCPWPVLVVALVVWSRFQPISNFSVLGSLMAGSYEGVRNLNTRPFGHSAGDGILELRVFFAEPTGLDLCLL